MTPDDQHRAERARQLLEDEVLIGALDAIEAGHVAALKSHALSDGDALIRSTAALQAAQALRAQLRAIIERGTERPRRGGVA